MQLASLINPPFDAEADEADEASAWSMPPEDESGPGPVQVPLPRLRLAARADAPALAALMVRVVARDEHALAQLYDETSSRVYGLALRICRRAAMAEEVVEDAYWQAWRQAPRFDPERGEVMSWLLAIARSRAIDALRREERFRHEALSEDDAEPTAEPGPAALELLDAMRGERRVHEALATLDARSRQLIALAFFRGLTHEEIATQARLPLGTVKSLIRRALLQLRQLLAAEPYTP